MKPGLSLTHELRAKVKDAIRTGLSPRHVPKIIMAVPEIPVTINGKKVEMAVKSVLNGKDVKPSSSVQNPDAISYFKRFRSLEHEPRDNKV